jgi:integrase/recombinase XerD
VRTRAAAEEQVQAFLQELAARRASPSLQLQASRTLAELAFHLSESGLRDLREVQERHLAAFARRLRERIGPRGAPLATNTQAAYLQRVRSFFAFLVRRGLLLVDPARALAVPAASTLPRIVLSPRQAERLMNAPSPWSAIGQRDRAILETFYGTGLRRGECARLDVQDVDLREGTLLVRDGKGKKDRLLPVPHRAALALDRYLREVRPELTVNPAQCALFLTAWRGRRLSEMGLVAVLRTHARAAGIPHLHPHVLRHTCATHLLRGGASIRHVQAILGHKHLKTTALYTRVTVEDLRQVLSRAHPRERAGTRRRRRYNEASR